MCEDVMVGAPQEQSEQSQAPVRCSLGDCLSNLPRFSFVLISFSKMQSSYNNLSQSLLFPIVPPHGSSGDRWRRLVYTMQV
jgi:hypothetical protein